MPGSGIYYVPFVVDNTPYCIWDWDIKRHNLEFINSIDPRYFEHVASINGDLLNGEDRQYAAIALRTAYYHSLETLFALICATVQAPDCVVGWLLKYQNRELTSVTKKIHKYQPVLSRLQLKPVCWETVAIEINSFDSNDSGKDEQMRKAFGELWRRFAHDFLNEKTASEYNSIKHGLRVSMGGFTLAIGHETVPGVPAPPEAMRSMGGSPFGTSFYVPVQLHNRTNFRVRRNSLNWRPENFVHALSLVSISISNVTSYLKLRNGVEPSQAEFIVPSDEDYFSKPWELRTGIISSDINSTIEEDYIEPLSNQEILATYNAGNNEDGLKHASDAVAEDLETQPSVDLDADVTDFS